MTYARKRRIVGAAMTDKLQVPTCWLPDLIHSQMATGNMAKAINDAIAKAFADHRPDDVRLYRNMLDQFCDYWADMQ